MPSAPAKTRPATTGTTRAGSPLGSTKPRSLSSPAVSPNISPEVTLSAMAWAAGLSVTRDRKFRTNTAMVSPTTTRRPMTRYAGGPAEGPGAEQARRTASPPIVISTARSSSQVGTARSRAARTSTAITTPTTISGCTIDTDPYFKAEPWRVTAAKETAIAISHAGLRATRASTRTALSTSRGTLLAARCCRAFDTANPAAEVSPKRAASCASPLVIEGSRRGSFRIRSTQRRNQDDPVASDDFPGSAPSDTGFRANTG